MAIETIEYKIKTASEEDIYSHLLECKDGFIPPLDETVNILEYSVKIIERSVTFEAWEDELLAGFIAAYFNDLNTHTGYITNVSLLKKYEGKGIAAALMRMCIQYAGQNDFQEIKLEVHQDNKAAIYLYRRFQFAETGNNGDFVIMSLKINS
jgi:ribosomal protein S18 acetylase RimI-like enzyme